MNVKIKMTRISSSLWTEPNRQKKIMTMMQLCQPTPFLSLLCDDDAVAKSFERAKKNADALSFTIIIVIWNGEK